MALLMHVQLVGVVNRNCLFFIAILYIGLLQQNINRFNVKRISFEKNFRIFQILFRLRRSIYSRLRHDNVYDTRV